jgi:hypothetical protein
MIVDFPNYKTRNAWYLHREVGNRSKYLAVLIDLDNSKSGEYKYQVGFCANHGEGHAHFTVDLDSEDNISAIHELMQKMLAIKPKMESGELQDTCKISTKSKRYLFEMIVEPETWLTMIRQEDGSYLKEGVKKNTPSTNGINVSFLAKRKPVEIGRISFYGGLKSALLLAHDLEVVMALIDGKPDVDIIKMKPQVAVNNHTAEELEVIFDQIEHPDLDKIEKEGALEREYIENLKAQAELPT